MKTPRELILEKHRNAETRLAAIRPEDLAAAARSAITAAPIEGEGRLSAVASAEAEDEGAGWLLSIARNFWRESIMPWHRVWMGMAAVWLGILALNFASHDAPQMAAAKAPATDSRVVLAAWRERRQMFAQLLGPAMPAVDAAPKIPGPRSSLRVELVVV
jgi:hypothetical protein